jgi:hypothetical protein
MGVEELDELALRAHRLLAEQVDDELLACRLGGGDP